MRLILSIIAIILWLVLGYFIKPCFDSNNNCNSGDDTSKAIMDDNKKSNNAANIASAAKVTGPLLFNWGKMEAVTGDGWNTNKQAILDRLKDGEVLEITGQYRADEAKPTNFDNLGLARASEIAKLFKPPLSDEQIELKGQLVNAAETDKNNMFKSAGFNYLKNTAAIKEIDDRTLIYFPFNSVNKLKDAEVEAYLDDVAERVKKSGEKVRLTGHTDSMSSMSSNQRLGQKRADIVKNYLISKGVKSSQIISTSKGEMQPVSGSYVNNVKSPANRRTELQIIK